MPVAQVRYPAAVFGYSAQVPQLSQVENYVASATVTSGNVVVLANTSGQVRNATAGDGKHLALGVALVSATTGVEVPVATAGIVTVNKGASASTSGDILVLSGTTAGTVDSIATTTGVTQLVHIVGLVGIAVSTQTAGDATITAVLKRP